MTAHIKSIASDIWKVISWPILAKTRNNRLFWAVLMAIATLVNTINLDSFWDIAFLILTASIFGHDWSAWWHRVDEEVDGSWYKESDIDMLMHERDELTADVEELWTQIRILAEELEKYRA